MRIVVRVWGQLVIRPRAASNLASPPNACGPWSEPPPRL